MKKLLIAIMCLLLVAATAMPGFAQTRYRHHHRRAYYTYGTKRTFWQKHRDKLTTAMGAGAGAIIGGAVGGGKGAAIGTLVGGGGSALYTYKIRKRHRTY